MFFPREHASRLISARKEQGERLHGMLRSMAAPNVLQREHDSNLFGHEQSMTAASSHAESASNQGAGMLSPNPWKGVASRQMNNMFR